VHFDVSTSQPLFLGHLRSRSCPQLVRRPVFVAIKVHYKPKKRVFVSRCPIKFEPEEKQGGLNLILNVNTMMLIIFRGKFGPSHHSARGHPRTSFPEDPGFPASRLTSLRDFRSTGSPVCPARGFPATGFLSARPAGRPAMAGCPRQPDAAKLSAGLFMRKSVLALASAAADESWCKRCVSSNCAYADPDSGERPAS